MSNSSFNPQVNLTATGVTAGTYGNGSNATQLVVNAQGQITTASTLSISSINGYQVGGFRNLLLNGAMQLWQRGTSGTGALAGSAANNFIPYTTADRWGVVNQGASGVIQVFQSTSAPTGFQYSLAFGRQAGQTFTSGIVLGQAIETINTIPLQGLPVTLSFWAKCGTTFSPGTAGASAILRRGTGTDETLYFAAQGAYTGGSIYPIITGFSPTTTWQYFQFTGTVDAAATELALNINFNGTGTAGADDNLYVTGVQIEVGTSATPFEFKPIGKELELCQRYYNKTFSLNTVPATGIGSNTGELQWDYLRSAGGLTNNWRVRWPVPMRISPTVTFYNPTSANAQARDITLGADCSSTSGSNVTEKGMFITTTGAASSAVGDQIAVHWAASAEL